MAERMPSINIEKAVRAYYSKVDLSNSDIKDLFDNEIGDCIMYRLKHRAQEKENETGKVAFSPYKVSTESAFLAWGLDIADLERRYSKLKKLGLISG